MNVKNTLSLCSLIAVSGSLVASNASADVAPARAAALEVVRLTSASSTLTCGVSFKASLGLSNPRAIPLTGTITFGDTTTPFTIAGGATTQALVQNQNADMLTCKQLSNVVAVIKGAGGSILAKRTFKPTQLYVPPFKSSVGGNTFVVSAEARVGSPVAIRAEVKAGATAYAGNVTLVAGSTTKSAALNSAPSVSSNATLAMPTLDVGGLPAMTFTFSGGPSGALAPQTVTYFCEDYTDIE